VIYRVHLEYKDGTTFTGYRTAPDGPDGMEAVGAKVLDHITRRRPEDIIKLSVHQCGDEWTDES